MWIIFLSAYLGNSIIARVKKVLKDSQNPFADSMIRRICNFSATIRSIILKNKDLENGAIKDL